MVIRLKGVDERRASSFLPRKKRSSDRVVERRRKFGNHAVPAVSMATTALSLVITPGTEPFGASSAVNHCPHLLSIWSHRLNILIGRQ